MHFYRILCPDRVVCIRKWATYEIQESRQKSGLRFVGSLDAGTGLFSLGCFQDSLVYKNETSLAVAMTFCHVQQVTCRLRWTMRFLYMFVLAVCPWDDVVSKLLSGWSGRGNSTSCLPSFCTDKAFPVQYKSCFPVLSAQAMRMTRKGEEMRPLRNDNSPVFAFRLPCG